jgi:hypothetical protein
MVQRKMMKTKKAKSRMMMTTKMTISSLIVSYPSAISASVNTKRKRTTSMKMTNMIKRAKMRNMETKRADTLQIDSDKGRKVATDIITYIITDILKMKKTGRLPEMMRAMEMMKMEKMKT